MTSTIEFIPEIHRYLCNGVITPSVTTVVSWLVGKDYSSVPKSILSAKADYGNRMHEWVEEWFKNGKELPTTGMMALTTEQVKRLKGFEYISSEEPVEFKSMVCGKYDLLMSYTDGFPEAKTTCLIDVKTTAEYDAEYLEWQLGFYKAAIEYMGIAKIDRCYCLWIPPGKLARLIAVDFKTAEECEDALDEYYIYSSEN